MDIKMHFDHFNINVTDLDASLAFYKENLGLNEVGEKRAPDGSFILKYLSSPGNDFRLELTWLRNHEGPYELGENESHLALRYDGNYDEIREFHRKTVSSASKIPLWAYISSMTLMIIGLKYCPTVDSALPPPDLTD